MCNRRGKENKCSVGQHIWYTSGSWFLCSRWSPDTWLSTTRQCHASWISYFQQSQIGALLAYKLLFTLQLRHMHYKWINNMDSTMKNSSNLHIRHIIEGNKTRCGKQSVHWNLVSLCYGINWRGQGFHGEAVTSWRLCLWQPNPSP